MSTSAIGRYVPPATAKLDKKDESADACEQPFEGLLRAQFKNRPGETKIFNGSFHIIDSKRGSIVRKDHWHRNISQGIQLKMSMIMLHLRTSSGKCPQPDCAGIGTVSSNDPLQMMWYVIGQGSPTDCAN